MTRTALAFPGEVWAELSGWLDEEAEHAGVLLARVIDDDEGRTLLVRSLIDVPDSSYLRRRRHSLAIRSTGWVPAVGAAADDDAVAIFVHSHPGGDALFSEWDDAVDDQLAPAFMDRSGKDLYASVVVAGTSESATATARVTTQAGTRAAVDVIRIVGDKLRLIVTERSVTADAHDRQVRLLGRHGQAVLQNLRVGVVGGGGTGSPVFEQLVRLGVHDITVIDDDIVTPSTVARGYGTTVADIGRPKVDVLAGLADDIGLGTAVRPIRGNLRVRSTTEELRHCDIVFCCVDGHGARAILNRWAYWHLAPVIDLAILVSVTDNGGVDVDGRVTWLAAGTACLLCRGRIDPHAAYAEQLDPEARRELAQQGYVPDLDEPEPSVVSYTTLMAGLAVTELLHRLFGFASPEPSELIIRVTDRQLSLNRRPPRDGCFCTNPANHGAGLTDAYLDVLWHH